MSSIKCFASTKGQPNQREATQKTRPWCKQDILLHPPWDPNPSLFSVSTLLWWTRSQQTLPWGHSQGISTDTSHGQVFFVLWNKNKYFPLFSVTFQLHSCSQDDNYAGIPSRNILGEEKECLRDHYLMCTLVEKPQGCIFLDSSSLLVCTFKIGHNGWNCWNVALALSESNCCQEKHSA